MEWLIVFLCVLVCVESVYVPKLDAIWMKNNGKSIFDIFINNHFLILNLQVGL